MGWPVARARRRWADPCRAPAGFPKNGDAQIRLPVFTRGGLSEPQAWVVAAPQGGQPGDFERLILQQAATVVALELMRQRAMRDTERRLAGDMLAEALTGRLGADDLVRRLGPFGDHLAAPRSRSSASRIRRARSPLWTAPRRPRVWALWWRYGTASPAP